MLWFSLLVMIPLIAVVVSSTDGGWSKFWDSISNEQTAAAIRLTVTAAAVVTVVNIVMGTLIAWVLVRDRFFGKRILEVLIDIPFALPTIVAGPGAALALRPQQPAGDRRRQQAPRSVPGVPVRDTALRRANRASRYWPNSTAMPRKRLRRSVPAG